jgi:hypothetical protein
VRGEEVEEEGEERERDARTTTCNTYKQKGMLVVSTRYLTVPIHLCIVFLLPIEGRERNRMDDRRG